MLIFRGVVTLVVFKLMILFFSLPRPCHVLPPSCQLFWVGDEFRKFPFPVSPWGCLDDIPQTLNGAGVFTYMKTIKINHSCRLNIPAPLSVWVLDLHFSLGGVLKYFLCSSLPGEMIQWDKYFSDGLKPPTSLGLVYPGLNLRCWDLTKAISRFGRSKDRLGERVIRVMIRFWILLGV